MTAIIPSATTVRIGATSSGSLGPLPRTAIKAPNPTNTPAIPANSRNRSASCIPVTSAWGQDGHGIMGSREAIGTGRTL